ncbi:hypothetical protein, partial [Cysteiniphilum litorale]|uniref:hypothetical protein n=2 Tax=Cysteiniphilum TaxID=2056696 RepID=UPI0019D41AF2
SISGMFSGDTGHDIADHANSFSSGMNKGISGGLVDQKYNRDHQIDHMVGETLGMVVGMGIGTTEARIATEAGGLIKSAITAVMEEKNVAGQVNATRGSKVFTTYTKVNPATGETYVGRTSGYGDVKSIVERRDAYHHMNAKGFEAARPDVASTSKAAIRGREQMMIEHYGGAKSMGGTSGNTINGISRFNPRKQGYVDAARNEFGDV